MDEGFEIPQDHWGDHLVRSWENYIPHWEKSLRNSIAQTPDPSERFAKWLAAKEAGNVTLGVRLIFIEQPYLEWAQAVERLLEKEELDTRQAVAHQILNPGEE